MKEGLYFGLSEDEYHALPCLSASGIKSLLISPTDFWTWSWMNPNKPSGDTEARIIGTAYHKRILEGKDAFYNRYCYDFNPSDYPNMIKTMDDLKEELSKHGIAPKGKKSDYISTLLSVDPDAQIYDRIYSSWESQRGDKQPLSAELIGRIEQAAAMIENHPQLSKCFSGGYPEVSVVWTDDGVPFKARFDYLKPNVVIDLKTFQNTMGKPIDRAIYYACASNKYHIQASFYLDRAMTRAIRFARDGKTHGDVSKDFITNLSKCTDPKFMFVFQQKGYASLARGLIFPKNSMFLCGLAAIDKAIQDFKENRDLYGTAPWVDRSPIVEMDDNLFPVFATEL